MLLWTPSCGKPPVVGISSPPAGCQHDREDAQRLRELEAAEMAG